MANWKTIYRYNRMLTGRKYMLPYWKLICCSWQHGVSFENFYELHFYQKTKQERKQYITASLRHELTRQVNENDEVHILKNKAHFANKFHDLLGRKIYFYYDLESHERNSPPPKLVVKNIYGQAGQGVFFLELFDTYEHLLSYIARNFPNTDEYIFEEFILQHRKLKNLNPSSVNTLRIVTFYDDKTNSVDVWGCYLRMGVDAKTDNLATGGIAAAVSEDGTVKTPAVAKDPFLNSFSYHPVTKEQIVGFEVPFYKEAINLVVEASKRVPRVRSIGWDVAITDNGPCLIEGNDNWGMTLFQIPCGYGLRSLANRVCDMKIVYD
ncbi:sugar-transfer associated ATP-grasp domain-containing protein [Limnospira maxima]|uniref:sugar-transfer associated ATP-grasp domain-containing protein n=1 Tax=Limnospira TaxID=2596745 RepID=UPI00135F13E4|nr:sugar-transfer associated ATP-grasp domain-containing protein [Limnospira maxima]MDC0838921.1 sugar-transfer associated ATP-grasp domain-containing protein [Limnoraphis robusta]